MYLLFLGKKNTNGIAPRDKTEEILYVRSKPILSPKNPTKRTIIELITKLIIIKVPLIKEGCSESISWTRANTTGPLANRKNPIITRTTNVNGPCTKRKIHIRRGFAIEIIRSEVLREILSEIEPAKRVPIAPENCSTDNDIPAIQRELPFWVKYVGKYIVKHIFNTCLNVKNPESIKKKGNSFIRTSLALNVFSF